MNEYTPIERRLGILTTRFLTNLKWPAKCSFWKKCKCKVFGRILVGLGGMPQEAQQHARENMPQNAYQMPRAMHHQEEFQKHRQGRSVQEPVMEHERKQRDTFQRREMPLEHQRREAEAMGRQFNRRQFFDGVEDGPPGPPPQDDGNNGGGNDDKGDRPECHRPFTCQKDCPFGHETDANGCQICACADPCKDVKCDAGKHCALFQGNSQPQCVKNCPPVNPLDKQEGKCKQECYPGSSNGCSDGEQCCYNGCGHICIKV